MWTVQMVCIQTPQECIQMRLGKMYICHKTDTKYVNVEEEVQNIKEKNSYKRQDKVGAPCRPPTTLLHCVIICNNPALY